MQFRHGQSPARICVGEGTVPTVRENDYIRTRTTYQGRKALHSGLYDR